MKKAIIPSKAKIREQLKEIRRIIDTSPNFIDQRLAYIVEEAVIYILKPTTQRGLVDTVISNTQILKDEIKDYPMRELIGNLQ